MRYLTNEEAMIFWSIALIVAVILSLFSYMEKFYFIFWPSILISAMAVMALFCMFYDFHKEKKLKKPKGNYEEYKLTGIFK